MMVFALMSIGLAYGITNALVLTQESRARQTALNLASQDLDQLRSLANPFEIRRPRRTRSARSPSASRSTS